MFEIKSNIKILIISEDQSAAHNCMHLLKKSGLSYTTILESGIESLQLCEAEHFDLIVCDQKTKHMSGWMFVQELKNSPKIRNCAMILMGHESNRIDDEKLKQYGLPSYQAYPLSQKGIMQAITDAASAMVRTDTLEHKYSEAKNDLIEQKTDSAITKYSHIHSVTNKSIRSAIGLVHSYEQSQNDSKVIEFSQIVAQKSNGSPTGIMFEIRERYKSGDSEKAEKLIIQLIEKTQSTPLYFLSTLELATKNNRIELCETIAKSAIKNGHRFQEFLNAIGKAQFARGELSECVKTLGKCLNEFGSNLGSLNLLGICLHRQKNHEKAREALREALMIAPMDHKVLFNLALVEADTENLASSKRYLELCLNVAPGFEKARTKLNEISEQTLKLNKAE
jgi:CheY-like chemotaxis protein/Tfp pilus assembly protein PilF